MKVPTRVVAMCVVVVMATAVEPPEESRLRTTLMKDYDSTAMPQAPMLVNTMTLEINGIEMHEDRHVMEVLCYLGFSWDDYRLKWQPDEYGGLDRVGMDPSAVWKPDLALYNSAVHQHMPETNLPVLVFATGLVMYIPGLNLEFNCVMDLKYWPHDAHNCTMKVGSWVHHGNLIDLYANDTEPEISFTTKNNDKSEALTTEPWLLSDVQLVRVSKTYPSDPDNSYVHIAISMLATRNAPAYAWIVKAPVICMSILTMVVFLLPPKAGEKIMFGGLCLIIDVQFLNYASSVIGHSPSHTPLIIQMVCQQMVLVMVSVVVSAVVVRMARGPHSGGLPRLIMRPASSLASILCLGNYADNALCSRSLVGSGKASDEVELGDDAAEGRKECLENQEWLMLAALLDRLALLLYFAICVITLIRFTSVL